MTIWAALLLGLVTAISVGFTIKVSMDSNAGRKRIKDMMHDLGYDKPID